MKRNASPYVGAIAVITTLILFFIITEERTNIDLWGIGFILFAEVFTTAGFICLPMRRDVNRPLYTGGGFTALSSYATVSVITSLIFMIMFRSALTSLISIQVVLAALTLIALIILEKAGLSAAESDRAILTGKQSLLHMRQLSQSLQAGSRNQSCEKELNRLKEALAYSDNAESNDFDDQIITGLEILSGLLTREDPQPAKEKIEELLALIHKRGIQVAASKRGKV